MSDRPLRILIRAPGEATHAIELADGKETLIGRSPDWSRLNASGDMVAISSVSVSGNHLRIRRDGDRLHITDLGSRNGTLVELLPHREIVIAPDTDEVAIHLAHGGDGATPRDSPLDARWTGRGDYVTSICEAIGVWLESRDLSAQVSISPRDEASVDGIGRIPLATGGSLLLESKGTAGPGWLDALVTIERWLLAQNLRFATEESMRAEGLVVASQAMRRAIARVVAAATSGARVLLITGPSGAGKEGLARCFHRHTGRAGPFVARNCAMFNKELVRSELFGAEKGAFTGSVQRIVGAVEAANEGTLFLDEIGELPQDVQPMLLRFLDHGEYDRIGNYGAPKIADVRIVAATNRDLRAAASEEKFRSDLWFRLSVHVVEVPPLRDRHEDVLAYLRLSKLDALTPEATELLLKHDWVGNFRELANFVERTLPIAKDGPISANVAARLLQEGALTPAKRPPPSVAPRSDDDALLALVQQAHLAFQEDHDGQTARTWDQIKTLVESYLKPILFARLSDSMDETDIEHVDIRVAAERMQADRGTALKQLRRYFDRFANQAGS